jgi:hypothetical protein
MKIASVTELKKEFNYLSKDDLVDLLNKLIRYSKENKEFVHYLLLESDFEENYIQKIKEEVNDEFKGIDTRSWKTMKKPIQRILRLLKKHIKFSKNPQSEIELLLFFCEKLSFYKTALNRNPIIYNIYNRQIISINKALEKLHEDIQFDYREEIEKAMEVLN